MTDSRLDAIFDERPIAITDSTSDALPQQVVATVYERDIDLLILEELRSSQRFRAWWLEHLNYSNPETHTYIGAWQSLPDANGESDLLLLVANEGGEKCAILIEDKIYAPAQPEQAQRYRVRGDVGREKGWWNTYITCLTAARGYLTAPANSADLYDRSIEHEDIVRYFDTGSDLVEEQRLRAMHKMQLLNVAIHKSRRGYSKVENPAVTQFLLGYWEISSEEFPELLLAKPGKGGDDSRWIYFPSPIAGRWIVHKLAEGRVELGLSGQATNLTQLNAANRAILDNAITLHATGNSASFRIAVGPVDHRAPADPQRTAIRQGLRAALRLMTLSPLIKV